MRALACVVLGALGACAPQPRADIGEVNEGQTICAKATTSAGVDVSHHNGTIDWAAAHAAGIDWVIMKATESTNFVDPMFATNWAAAGQNGVIRGAYHFFRPAVDATMQADYFVQHAGMPAAGDLPPTIDLEVTDGVGGSQVAASALVFLQRVQQLTGRTPIIYTSPSFFNSTLGAPAGFGGYVIWIANWQVTCPNVPNPPWSDWSFWQTSDSGSVNGISGAVDLDKFNGSLSDLQGFVNSTQPGADLAGTNTPQDGSASGADGGVVAAEDMAGGGGGGGMDAAHPLDGAIGPKPKAESGCSCDLDGHRSAPSPRALLLLLLALGLARRAARARVR